MGEFLKNRSVLDGHTDDANTIRNTQDPHRRADTLEDYQVGLLVDLMVLEAKAEAEARRCVAQDRPTTKRWWSLEADIEFCCSAIEEIPTIADKIRHETKVRCRRNKTHLEDRVFKRIERRAMRLLRAAEAC